MKNSTKRKIPPNTQEYSLITKIGLTTLIGIYSVFIITHLSALFKPIDILYSISGALLLGYALKVIWSNRRINKEKFFLLPLLNKQLTNHSKITAKAKRNFLTVFKLLIPFTLFAPLVIIALNVYFTLPPIGVSISWLLLIAPMFGWVVVALVLPKDKKNSRGHNEPTDSEF